LDEVFGSENFINQIGFRTAMTKPTDRLNNIFDYVLWYGKNEKSLKYRPLFVKREFTNENEIVGTQQIEASAPQAIYRFTHNGKIYNPINGWRVTEKSLRQLAESNRLQASGTLRFIRYVKDFPYIQYDNIWNTQLSEQNKSYVVQTNTDVIARCILLSTDPGDLVLDPTCGSGTTAYVAEQWGRRWITIDTSRVAIALARTRLMAGRYPYYLLSDSPEGLLKEAELNAQLPPSPLLPTTGDIKKGFVYKRVPHITLKSIANNEEIDLIHEKWQLQLEALREKINRVAAKNWQEWEIPRLPSSYQSDKERTETEKALKTAGITPGSAAWKLVEEWWSLRRQRQQEIDASIARRADTELLYDQPYEDNKRVRVSGPFTVESLSPHRVLSTDEERPKTEQEGQNQSAASGGFETLIIDNLRAAGVENTKKDERLKFTRLEPFAGTWLHAVGEYQEKDGVTKRVAVCIGPEHGTVSPDLIKDAAKEAVQGVGFDLLVVLGFAFDPHVSEEIHRYGKLTVLPARINPDLQMGNLLLKKSGSGNLFMVFGEPDVEVSPQPDGKLTVTIKGVDIYDPTTGEIRSSSTDDIACWFIDTDYNGESFFVRHAYFTGADEPYDKLKRALRAEVDEAAWSALYATTSYPFEKPKSGKIAVKVINHYGDEVLKVYEIEYK
jgi:adenine-specific DNA-methyltransferase